MPLRRALVALGLVPLGLHPALDAQATARNKGERVAAVEAEPRIPVAFAGIVVDRSGSPVDGVVVVSSAGGRAVTDRSGSYRLEALVPAGARSVHITAAGGPDGSLVASTRVDFTGGLALAHVAPLELASASTCQPSWLPTFGGEPGTNLDVSALAVFDDGSGPTLYAGGGFTTAGGKPANYVAKWNGSSWTPLGSGLGGPTYPTVLALTVFDDGSGPALYAGGDFTTADGATANHIARWNGSNWAPLGSGMNNRVQALMVFDDGSGPALYAGGGFTTAGGVAASYISKWDGSTWAEVGSGMNGFVWALGAFDDGGGPALYAGGAFTTAGGVAANNIAKWDGANWTILGSGLNNTVHALIPFDDGSGPALYAGGSFSNAGGVAANRIAKRNGSSWKPLAMGLNSSGVHYVLALAVFDDGGGPALYAGGFANTGVTPNRIARWNGSTWATLGTGIGAPIGAATVGALAVFDDGRRPALYTGGSFLSAGGVPVSNVAKWDGAGWTALGSGSSIDVAALVVFDDGGGSALYAGGSTKISGGTIANYIAKWNGVSWAQLGNWTNALYSRVYALAVFDDGTGSELYAGGNFNDILKWNGSSWVALGSGMNGPVSALCVFDDGGGPALYAGGIFTIAGGVAANSIAKWDGSSWTVLGSGLSNPGFPPFSASVQSLTVFDDGSGLALYAGGFFTAAGGVAANSIAKWNGSTWAAVGSGVAGGPFSLTDVCALTVFDDGSGPALYAGGDFTIAGSAAANRIARWDGASWTALGSGLTGTFRGTSYGTSVTALTVFDDGSGPALYAGGIFTTAGAMAASCIAKWDGASWVGLGSGMSGGSVTGPSVAALTVFNDRTGPALYAAGDFTSVPDSGDSYLAKWGCPDTNPPTIVCPASILVDDRRDNGSGETLSFEIRAIDAQDPTPSLVCVPPSGSLFPRGTTVVNCTATDFSGNQSTCQFTITVHSKLRDL